MREIEAGNLREREEREFKGRRRKVISGKEKVGNLRQN